MSVAKRFGVGGQTAGWSIALLMLIGLGIGIRLWRADPPAPEVDSGPARTALTAAERRAEFLGLMNTGKAHLENGTFQKAVESLTAALKLQPESTPALRNLARAYLFSGESDLAVERLKTVQMARPDSAAAAYLMGVAFAWQSRLDAAIPHFERAARLDARTAAIRFQLAKAYDATRQNAKAVEQLREAVRLDPAHSAAQFQLAMHARKTNDTDEYRRRLREFVRLRDLYGDPSAVPLALEARIHTKAEPAALDAEHDSAGAPAQEIDVRFTDATGEVIASAADRAAAALAIIDMDEHGRYTSLVVDRDGGLSRMTLSPAGKFQRRPLELKLHGSADIHTCLAGNYYDDPSQGDKPRAAGRLTDVMLIGDRESYLLKRIESDSFQDVTQSAGLAGLAGRGGRWVDYEYDGDLDLLLARKTGLQLWQNNGNGTFRNVTAEVGIANTIECADLQAVDWDANGGVDLIAARGTDPTLVYENQRAGRLAPMPEPPGPWPAARRVLSTTSTTTAARTCCLPDRRKQSSCSANRPRGGVSIFPTSRSQRGPSSTTTTTDGSTSVVSDIAALRPRLARFASGATAARGTGPRSRPIWHSTRSRPARCAI